MSSISIFTKFLLEKGYQLIAENKQLRTMTYKYDGLFIRLTEDINGERFIELSRTNNQGWEGWYDMTVIRCLVLGVHYEKDGPVHFEQLSEFFMDHYGEIVQAFNTFNFPKTEAALAALKKQRAKVLFGFELE